MKKLVLNKVFCGFLTAVIIMACEAKLALGSDHSPSVATHAQTSATRSSNYSSGGSMNTANSHTFMGDYGHNSAANGFQKASTFSNDLPTKTAVKIISIKPKFDSRKIIANQSGKVNLIKPIPGSLTLSGTTSSGVLGSAAPIALNKVPPKTNLIISALNHNSSAGTKPMAIMPNRTHPIGSQVLTELPINRVPIYWNANRSVILAAGAGMGQGGGVCTYVLNDQSPGDPGDGLGDSWGPQGSTGEGGGGNGDPTTDPIDPPTDPTDPPQPTNPNDPPPGGGLGATNQDLPFEDIFILLMQEYMRNHQPTPNSNLPDGRWCIWTKWVLDPETGLWVWLGGCSDSGNHGGKKK
ncbi:MAG: hypothetical protein ABSA26_08585 [Thermoguttaceae bacterium]|jgi:hypothetical protein